MFRRVATLCILPLCFMIQTANSAEPVTPADKAKQEAPADPRQLVTMPEQARQLMRQDMLDHLAVLSELLGYLAGNKLDQAATVAETKLGRSSMGKHRATGMGPGQFMPQEMRSLGWGMHDAASEFAELAKKGDSKGAQLALQKVTNACVACHYSYRTR